MLEIKDTTDTTTYVSLWKWTIKISIVPFIVKKVEQELPTLPEHLSSPPGISRGCVTRSVVLYVYL
jgi:hypothetical protein